LWIKEKAEGNHANRLFYARFFELENDEFMKNNNYKI